MKRLYFVFLCFVLCLVLCSCGKKEPEFSYTGTWRTAGVEKDGSFFSSEELSALHAENYIDGTIVIKEGGKAYLAAAGHGRIVDWEETEEGILIDRKEGWNVDGKLYIDLDVYVVVFEKESESETIVLEDESSNDHQDSTGNNSNTEHSSSDKKDESESSSDKTNQQSSIKNEVLDIPETGDAQLAEELEGAVVADEGDGKICASVVAWNTETFTITIRIDNATEDDITTAGQPIQYIDGAKQTMSAFKNASTAMQEIPAGKYQCVTYIVDERSFTCETLEWEGALRWKDSTKAGADTFAYYLPITFGASTEESVVLNEESPLETELENSEDSSQAPEESESSDEPEQPEESDSSEEPSQEPEASEEPEESSVSDSEIRPEFQEAMDEYVAFFEEYCEFMDTYAQSTNQAAMILDYLSFIQQYTETMEALGDIGEQEMTTAEALLYSETMLKINQMLL